MFVVPLTLATLLVQVPLCRRSKPLPRDRVGAISRACKITLLTSGATLGCCWASVVVGANSVAWKLTSTGALIAGLSLVSARTVLAAGRLVAVRAIVPSNTDPRAGDRLADVVADCRLYLQRLGPLRKHLLRAVDWADDEIAPLLRTRPITAAIAASAAFGVGVGVNQGVREDYSLAAIAATSAMLAIGMFAAIVVVGAYVRLVTMARPLSARRRRLLDASVSACFAGVLALALRGSLWALIGTTGAAGGVAQLAVLVAFAMLVAFCSTLAAESVLRLHEPRSLVRPR